MDVSVHLLSRYSSCRLGKQMQKYFIRKHVFVCISNGYIVLLDLKNDKYICLDKEKSRYLAHLLANGPSDRALKQTFPETPGQNLEKAGRALVETGLLTTKAENGKPDPLTRLEPATSPLLDRQNLYRPKIHAGHVLRFFYACTVASWKLNRWPLQRAVRSVERRRRLKHEKWSEREFTEARRLVSIFDLLRPFFPANYLCLFDSLALVEFLAPYGLFPTWVYGVEAEPFNAHCWIQEGDVLFNDLVDRVRLFTPIMAA